MSDKLRIVIADDHALFRDGLRALLASAEDTVLVGEAADGAQAVALCAELQPDVVLLDVQMPADSKAAAGGDDAPASGIEAARRIVAASPHIGVLMVTMYDDDQSVFAAMRAGARGYVLKGASHAEVLRAIRAVAGGEAIFSAPVAVRLMDYFASMRPAPLPQALPELSERERDVLRLIAEGLNNAEVAERLVISPKTVRNHVSNILSKLQVADRAQAILRAREAGLG